MNRKQNVLRACFQATLGPTFGNACVLENSVVTSIFLRDGQKDKCFEKNKHVAVEEDVGFGMPDANYDIK